MRQLLRLLVFVLVFGSTSEASANPLQQALEQFQALNSYSVILRSYGDTEQIISYRYQKPGYVRMDFVQPHPGAALVYRPDSGKVQLRPFGFSHALVLSLKPTSRLVRSPSGHRVDESDVGVLLEQARRLSGAGRQRLLPDESSADGNLVGLEITGQEKGSGGVQRYLLWLDKELKLPRRAEAYDEDNRLIEGVFFDELVINPELGDIFTL
ncbi:MAG: DUF1571 domain-containing protein [Desulfuromonadales bacterium]|nr:DUF1571 domain-containing protein [Desulfuromonadales bacterium]MBN2793091.1 DUF1571 domain-containing protein [Desulfuromonadales bacterium]